MDRRSFLKNTGWSFLGLAASGSLLGSCVAGSKEAKKIMPSASNLKVFWGDLHNHCNITYGHGDMRDAFEAAKGQLDFVSVTPHAMWPDIPGANDPRLKWVIDYHTGAFKRLREGGYEKYVKMTNEYNKEGEFLTFVGYEAHSMEHGDHVALNYDLDAPLVECTSIEDWKEKAKGHKVFVTPHHMGYQGGYRGYNFPAGDTVALNRQQEDFYSLAYREGQRVYPNKINMDSLTRDQQRTVYDLYYNAGRNLIRTNPQMYGDIVVRPVDRRENYVKRCVGLPGDTLQIKDTQVYIDGKAIENPEDMQLNYFVQTTGPYIPENMFRELGISNDDQILMTDDFNYEEGLMQMGLDRRDAQGRLTPVYHLPLTKKMYDTLIGNKKLISRIVMEPENLSGQMYPQNLHTKWTRDNYGPIWIPEKGATITLTKDNLPVYERCIVAYEGNTLEQKPDGIYINGEKTDTYTFKLDYYWMMGDNRHNSLDSRYWGFVPEDHVVGKPIVVWLSLDKDRGWFDGKIRWNRIFKWVH